MALSPAFGGLFGLLALMIMAAGPAQAQTTDTDTLTVTATVKSGCQLTGGTMAFGDYVSGQTTDLDVSGSINYANCAVGTLTFALDGGTNGNVSDRKMKSGGNTLNYQLFRNSTRTANWGTGGDSQQVQLLVAGGGSLAVYGRIPKSQAAAAGSYSDTVTITLTF